MSTALSERDVARILDDAQRAVRDGDGAAALEVLAPLAPARTDDAALATLWLSAARLAPGVRGLVDDVRAIAEAHRGDADIAIRSVAALVASAELRGPDEGVVRGGAATLAVELADRALAALDARALRDPDVAGYLHAGRASALRLCRDDADEDVVRAYRAALAADDARGGWWLALAVHHKWKLRFAEALDALTHARALLGSERRVLWNVAICATGAGKGDVAIDAMRALSFDAKLARGGMPEVHGVPPVELRLRAHATGLAGDPVPAALEAFEVVRVAPLSPVHGVVLTPTLRDCAADVGDVVLWDAAPVAVRAGTPRMPLVAVLRRGDEHRFRFLAREQREGQVAALTLPGAQLFVQHARVDFVCPRCAAGETLLPHEHVSPEEHRVVRGKLVAPGATDLATLRDALGTLLRENAGIALVVPGLHEALGDARAAGKAHQAWGGIERTATR